MVYLLFFLLCDSTLKRSWIQHINAHRKFLNLSVLKDEEYEL